MRRPWFLTPLLVAGAALAQDEPAAPPETPAAEAEAGQEGDDRVVTAHQVTVDGEAIDYTATAGKLVLRSDDDEPKAEVFYVAYVRDEEAADLTRRPVTFAFNGGPGSSSVWLHLGALGPRRVTFGEEGEPLPPPARLADNPWSWLDLTDLVFVDPVSTGYSRAAEGVDAKLFHGLAEDIQWVGEFVRLWLTREGRWGSPKFLAGESYGTTRAAGLAQHLQDRHGMFLNGVVLVSPVLNFQTIRFDRGNDTPYWLYLPSYAATAWYHHALDEELQEHTLEDLLREVEGWAREEYLPALALGAALPPDRAAEVAKRLSRYTGLSLEFVRAARLRIRMDHFAKELLRRRGLTVGRFDSRYLGRDRDDVGERYEYDPSYAVVQGTFTAGFNAYVRRELGYETERTYEVLTGRVHPWSYGRAGTNRYVDVADDLSAAVHRNPALKVLVACGIYDLATPYFASDYTVAHLGLDPTLRGNVLQTYYRAGHMMYVRREDLAQLKADAARFYAEALGGE